MNICTLKNNKRIALALLPFKAYVVFAFPFYFLFRLFYPHPLHTYVGNNTTIFDPLANALLEAFVLCAPILLLGAVIQFAVNDNKAGLRTIFFALAPTLVLGIWIFLWVIAHLL